jgi:TnpA family transposase
MEERTRRLHILDEAEVAALFDRPRFNNEQRAIYFSLSAHEELLLHGLHSVKSRCFFILQLGYFKHSYQFFTFGPDELQDDVRYLQARYFPDENLVDVDVTKVTRLKQQRLILNLFNFRICDAEDRRALLAKARQAAKISTKPLYIFRELMEHLSQARQVSPAYTSLQDIIGRALNSENERLVRLLENKLGPSDAKALQRLLDDSDGIHKITQLRHQPKDSSVKEMKAEVAREGDLKGLYTLMQQLLPELGISNESVTYYASLVDHYSVFRLKRLDRLTAYLYLLCYVRYRYQKLNDNLIISFRHHVTKFDEAAEDAAKERVYAYRIETNQNLGKAAQILDIVLDGVPAGTPFADFQAQAFAILERPKLEQVSKHITGKVVFNETAFAWDYLDAKAGSFKAHLRHAIRAAEFTGSFAHDPVVTAVDFLKQTFMKDRSLGEVGTSSFPTRHLSKQAKRYLYDAEDRTDITRPLPDRYEFHTYRLLKQGLDAGDIHCRDSIRFRSLEDDLISAEQWHRDKAALIAELDLPILTMPIEAHLAELKTQLETRLVEVNQRIADGDNEHFRVKRRRGKDGWTLRYPTSTAPDDVNHPFYSQLKQTGVRAVLKFTQESCGFLDAFEHVLGRYRKSGLDRRTLTACLIAWGSNMGLGKMGEISDIGFDTLASTSQNFIRLETLRAANDLVSNEIADLPLFQAFNIGDKVHSSSDGQRFESQLDTFNARYSYRYFGKRKGVVAYTVVANHVPINAFVIGADEHESHYVFDGLFNNSTTIRPEIHSTDTHGTNELNFALLHVFRYQFAPRYKDIRTKLKTSLYGFHHPSHYPEFLLKPIRKLNDTLIVNDWDNMLRVFVSLAYKSTTQSVIVAKLSSYLRANTTKRALWEYDNIIKSLYLLDYVDLPVLRQGVQTALNRGENYHQLKRAVAFANFGRLRYRTEHDQAIWNECARLITNCVIYFNSALLSTLIDAKEQRGEFGAATNLKTISPVAWQHINFAGRYEFRKEDEAVDLGDLIKNLI